MVAGMFSMRAHFYIEERIIGFCSFTGLLSYSGIKFFLICMFLPQLLNCLCFLRWRRSSSKIIAGFLGIRSPLSAAVLQQAGLPLPLSAAAWVCLYSPGPPFYQKAFRAFCQVNALPVMHLFMPDMKPFCRFTMPQMFFPHRFDYLFFEFRRASLILFLSWHC